MRRTKTGYTVTRSMPVVALTILLIISSHALQSLPEKIFKAAAEGDLASVKALIEQNPDLVKAKDEEENTPLHEAAAAGRLDIVEYLLSKGADVNTRNTAGQNPLLHAAYYGRTPVVELFQIFPSR